MSNDKASIADFLLDIFQSRRQKNSYYSKRAFARDLGLSSGRLSEILQGKSIPNTKSLIQISSALDLSEAQKQKMLEAVEISKLEIEEATIPVQLTPEQFSIVCDWEHFAVMSLMKTKAFRSDALWIAQRLKIESQRVTQVLHNLESANLIARKGDTWRANKVNITTTQDIPSKVIRSSHEQKIQLALKSLQSDPVQVRDISSITMPLSPDDLAEAKKMIVQFRRRLAKAFGGKCCTEVYNLNIQLFPLTEIQSEGSAL